MSTGPASQEPDLLFERASRDVLTYLHEHVPMAMWAVTRVENGHQTYLVLEDDTYGIRAGVSYDWQASFCVHMAAGRGPAVAPDAQAAPVYAAADVNDALSIGAYAGTPIIDTDGSLFGVLCGLDPEVGTPELARVEPLLVLLSTMLTTALTADRRAHSLTRSALAARLAADVDVLTGVHSRGAWDRLMEAEALPYAALADPTAILVVDLDDLKVTNDKQGHLAGDELIVRAARAISGAVRSADPVARLGGDEFAVLLRDCTADAAQSRAEAVRQALGRDGVQASVGVAAAAPATGLRGAQSTADDLMYVEKRARKASQQADV